MITKGLISTHTSEKLGTTHQRSTLTSAKQSSLEGRIVEMRIKKNNNNNNKSRLHFPHKDTQNVWFIVKAKSLWKSPINLFVRREQKLLGDRTRLDQNLIPFWKLSSTMTCFTLSYEKFELTMDLHTLKILKTKSLHKQTFSLKEHGYVRRDEVILLNL